MEGISFDGVILFSFYERLATKGRLEGGGEMKLKIDEGCRILCSLRIAGKREGKDVPGNNKKEGM